jgi:hypothetical protein
MSDEIIFSILVIEQYCTIHLMFKYIETSVWTYGREERCIKGFGGETWGKWTTERPRHRWEDNIKMDLGDVGWVGMSWIDLAEDRDMWRAVVNAVMNLRFS